MQPEYGILKGENQHGLPPNALRRWLGLRMGPSAISIHTKRRRGLSIDDPCQGFVAVHEPSDSASCLWSMNSRTGGRVTVIVTTRIEDFWASDPRLEFVH